MYIYGVLLHAYIERVFIYNRIFLKEIQRPAGSQTMPIPLSLLPKSYITHRRRQTWVPFLKILSDSLFSLVRRYMAEILLMRRKTPFNQSIASEYKYDN